MVGKYQQNKPMKYAAIGIVAVSLGVFYILSLVGCISTSPGIPDLYLVKLEDVKTNASVRVGYFGMNHNPCLWDSLPLPRQLKANESPTTGLCAGFNSNLTCQPSYMADNRTLTDPFADRSLKDFLLLGRQIQEKIIVFVPLFVGALLLLSSILSLIIWDMVADKGSPTARNARAAVSYLTSYSVAGAVGAAASVTMASRALQFAGTSLGAGGDGGDIRATGGMALQVLQWLAVVFTLGWHLVVTVLWGCTQ
ncbi:uncharacterized protein E0L32_003794 [Thyridium curvatum]|uniref:Uncharacterized protein n=1 Tax=Thyridium curvatum TaxID=1093900 RepID=A0A507BIT4_9PEZI|nr:uncharacterized protein E0L32_003794 [Thyridium curvatum]TPX16500.1 hypothetical protein E0L32_003794 [Thyridium curvatum]